jgi:hypothetical protein
MMLLTVSLIEFLLCVLVTSIGCGGLGTWVQVLYHHSLVA